MTTYLKPPAPPSLEISQDLRDRVSAILSDIDRNGLDAVRRWSQELDSWNPPSFVVSEEDIRGAGEALGDELKGHIAFAQEQVRRFAQAQRGTLQDLELEIGPGVVLGHRHMPVGAVGAYVPGGRYPMLASSFMTVLVAKVAGVDEVVCCAPPQRDRGMHPAML
jgi:sulfopropanediol 3-dehydrogenase